MARPIYAPLAGPLNWREEGVPCECVCALHIPAHVFTRMVLQMHTGVRPQFKQQVSAILRIFDSYISAGGRAALVEVLRTDAQYDSLQDGIGYTPATIRIMWPSTYDFLRETAAQLQNSFESTPENMKKQKMAKGVSTEFPHPRLITCPEELSMAFAGNPDVDQCASGLDLTPYDNQEDAATENPMTLWARLKARQLPGMPSGVDPSLYFNQATGIFCPPTNPTLQQQIHQRWLSGSDFTRVFAGGAVGLLRYMMLDQEPPSSELFRLVRFSAQAQGVPIDLEAAHDNPKSVIYRATPPEEQAVNGELLLVDPSKHSPVEWDPRLLSSMTEADLCKCEYFASQFAAESQCNSMIRTVSGDPSAVKRLFERMTPLIDEMTDGIQPGVTAGFAQLRRGMSAVQREVRESPEMTSVFEGLCTSTPPIPEGMQKPTYTSEYFNLAKLWACTMKIGLIPQQGTIFLVKFLTTLTSLDPSFKHIFLAVYGPPNIGKSVTDTLLKQMMDPCLYSSEDYSSAKAFAHDTPDGKGGGRDGKTSFEDELKAIYTVESNKVNDNDRAARQAQLTAIERGFVVARVNEERLDPATGRSTWRPTKKTILCRGPTLTNTNHPPVGAFASRIMVLYAADLGSRLREVLRNMTLDMAGAHKGCAALFSFYRLLHSRANLMHAPVAFGFPKPDCSLSMLFERLAKEYSLQLKHPRFLKDAIRFSTTVAQFRRATIYGSLAHLSPEMRTCFTVCSNVVLCSDLITAYTLFSNSDGRSSAVKDVYTSLKDYLINATVATGASQFETDNSGRYVLCHQATIHFLAEEVSNCFAGTSTLDLGSGFVLQTIKAMLKQGGDLPWLKKVNHSGSTDRGTVFGINKGWLFNKVTSSAEKNIISAIRKLLKDQKQQNSNGQPFGSMLYTFEEDKYALASTYTSILINPHESNPTSDCAKRFKENLTSYNIKNGGEVVKRVVTKEHYTMALYQLTSTQRLAIKSNNVQVAAYLPKTNFESQQPDLFESQLTATHYKRSVPKMPPIMLCNPSLLDKTIEEDLPEDKVIAGMVSICEYIAEDKSDTEGVLGQRIFTGVSAVHSANGSDALAYFVPTLYNLPLEITVDDPTHHGEDDENFMETCLGGGFPSARTKRQRIEDSPSQEAVTFSESIFPGTHPRITIKRGENWNERVLHGYCQNNFGLPCPQWIVDILVKKLPPPQHDIPNLGF